LFTTQPTETGTGTEVSGGSYARVAITLSSAAGTPTSSSNTNQIDFPIATASWGTIVALALFDASSGGNMIAFTEGSGLSLNPTVSSGESVRFNVGDVVFTLD
jgi:hypothetical protein